MKLEKELAAAKKEKDELQLKFSNYITNMKISQESKWVGSRYGRLNEEITYTDNCTSLYGVRWRMFGSRLGIGLI